MSARFFVYFCEYVSILAYVMAVQVERKTEKDGVWIRLAKDWLLLLWLSSLGWIWEMLYGFFFFQRFSKSGFLSLPICPIYGFTIVGFFYLMGVPQGGRYALKFVKSVFWRYIIYAFVAFLIPTLSELFVGFFFHGIWGVRLWNYSALPLNVLGYVSVPISLAWAVVLTLFMRIFFLPMRTFFQSAGVKFAVIAAALSLIVVGMDFVYNMSLLIF